MGIVARIVGTIVTATEKAWITAGLAAVPDGADIESVTGSQAKADAAQAAAQTYADGLGIYQGALTRDFTTGDLTTDGDYGYRTDEYSLQLRAASNIMAQRLNSYAINRALSVKRESMVAFWPMREQTGEFIEDYTGNGHHAKIITGAALGATGAGDGSTAIDTTTAGVDAYSAGFVSAFNPAEFSIRVIMAADTWGSTQSILYFAADSNNFVAIQVNNFNRLVLIYKAGGTTKSVDSISLGAPTDFVDIVLTVSASNDRMIAYVNTAQFGSTQTGLGTWIGSLATTTTCIGCFANTPTFPLDGRISFSQVWDAELSAAEVQALSFGSVVGFGDSITGGTAASSVPERWLNITASGIGRTLLVNSGIGATVLQNTVQNTAAVIGGALTNNGRDTYTTRITAYNPEYVFILYGLNDLRFSDVAFTSANFENDLSEIIDGLISAGVYSQNIVIGSPPYIPVASYLLFSPYNGGSTAKHEAYVASCAAVATEKNTKYIDVYQWMIDNGGDALVSVDGIHPNDAGHAQIAAAFLSVL